MNQTEVPAQRRVLVLDTFKGAPASGGIVLLPSDRIWREKSPQLNKLMP